MAAMAFVSASVIPRSALIIWSVERGRAIRKTLFVWWSSAGARGTYRVGDENEVRGVQHHY